VVLGVIPGYGHQDVFMGKRVDQDVFPAIVKFMASHADGVASVRTA
jgi:cholesterol oxidase